MKTLSLFVSFAIAILSLPVGAFAEDNFAAQIKSITDDHKAKMAAFSEKVRSLPRAEQGQFYQTGYPSAEEPVTSIKMIIFRNPKDPAVIDAVNWVLRNGRRNANGGVDPYLLKVLEEHHLNDDGLVETAATLGFSSDDESRRFLKTLMEKSTVSEVRGMALYSYAATIQRDETKTDEYVMALEKLIKEYPGLQMRGRDVIELAKGKLFAAKSLGIGHEAPEIIGKDVDGKEMKLSDYRGKIVVIDFWGDW